MDKKLEARIARLEKLMCNEGNDDGANLYAEANDLFYKALAKYRAARLEAMHDGLDDKLFNRLTRMVDAFADAGTKLVNNGNKWFNWDAWNANQGR